MKVGSSRETRPVGPRRDGPALANRVVLRRWRLVGRRVVAMVLGLSGNRALARAQDSWQPVVRRAYRPFGWTTRLRAPLGDVPRVGQVRVRAKTTDDGISGAPS